MIPQRTRITALVSFTRFRLSLAVAVSGAAGYVLRRRGLDAGTALTTAGILLLASASSGLNQIQERTRDALMLRTLSRPLPTGTLRPETALLVTVPLFGGGAAALLVLSPLAAFLGLLTVVWYNGVYTPLKTRSPYSPVPGAVTGAFPPLIGWTAAGGGAFDLPALGLALFLFLWQIPHFLVLQAKYGNEFRRAGFPILFSRMNAFPVRLLLFGSSIALAGVTAALPSFRVVSGEFPSAALMVASAAFAGYSLSGFVSGKSRLSVFGALYAYQVLVLALVVWGALTGRTV